MFSKILSRTESRIMPAPDPLLESNVISLISTNLGWFVDVVFIELTNEPVANKYVDGAVYVDVSLTNLNTGPVQVNVLPLAVPVAAWLSVILTPTTTLATTVLGAMLEPVIALPINPMLAPVVVSVVLVLVVLPVIVAGVYLMNVLFRPAPLMDA